MTVQQTLLTPHIGVDFTGVDLEKDAHDADFVDTLRKALGQHLFVRIRNQQISPKTMTDLAANFGPLLDIRRAGGDALHVPGHDRIKVISNGTDPETARPLGDGNSSAQVWHSDSTTWEVPVGHIAFYCRTAPDPAPETRFLNMIKVYEELPETLKSRIAQLRVMHHVYPRQIEYAIAHEQPSLPLEDRRIGRIHPLVRRHLPTNRPVLYLPVRRDSLIVGWTESDSRELLEELWGYVDTSPYVVSAALLADDFVIWDNTATVHSRDGWPEEQVRTMWHVSAEGEVPTPVFGGRAPNIIGLSPEQARAAIAPYMQTIPDPDGADDHAGVRIWHQSMAAMGDFGAYETLLRKHIETVVPADVAVEIHGAAPDSYGGRPPGQVLRYPYLKHVIQTQAIAACRRAEAEGYDAVALATFSDPYLRECRSVVDIPVVSMPESVMFVASSLAAKCALIALHPASVIRLRELVDAHGIGSRVSGIYPLQPPMTEHDLVELMSANDLGEHLENLEQVATQARSDGAEILIPAEGALNEVLWAHGIRSLGGLPVLDGLGATLSYTRLMVDLQRTSGVGVSRVSTFAKPPAELMAEIS